MKRWPIVQIRVCAAIFSMALLAAPLRGAASDFGPPRDVGTVRTDARVLLAHRARLAKVDPKAIAISGVVVDADQAVLSWDIGPEHGLMGLIRQDNRWWDALDATSWDQSKVCWTTIAHYPLNANANPQRYQYAMPTTEDLLAWGFSKSLTRAAIHNSDIALVRPTPEPTYPRPIKSDCDSEWYELPDRVPVNAKGGSLSSLKAQIDPYEMTVFLAPNDAVSGTMVSNLYARPPTHAEFLPYPTPYRIVSDAVMFFDLTIDAPKPVSFQKGTTFDVWFPFVLDDKLKYSLSFGGGREPIGPVPGSVFDNVVHFDLPGFTALPGKELMGEIDGDVH